MPDNTEIERRVRELITELAKPGADIGGDTELKSLDIDSLDLAEVAQTMADEYGAEVPTGELERVQRISELADLIGVYARR